MAVPVFQKLVGFSCDLKSKSKNKMKKEKEPGGLHSVQAIFKNHIGNVIKEIGVPFLSLLPMLPHLITGKQFYFPIHLLEIFSGILLAIR